MSTPKTSTASATRSYSAAVGPRWPVVRPYSRTSPLPRNVRSAAPTVGCAAAVVAQWGHLGRRLGRRSGVEWEAIDGVGVGVPGVVADGRLRMAPNLPPFGDVEVGVAFADELDAEVIVDNDVNM